MEFFKTIYESLRRAYHRMIGTPPHEYMSESVGTPLEEVHQISAFTVSSAEPGKPDPLDGVVIRSSSPFPRFAEKVDIWFPIPTFVSADEACRKLTGRLLPIGDQRFGPCCTAYSTADAIKLARCQAILRSPNPPAKPIPVPANFSIPHLYCLTRCNVYGGKIVPPRINRDRDGSDQYSCVLAAKELGVAECKKYPWGDMTYYDPQLCTSFIIPSRPKPWAVFGVPPASMADLAKVPLDAVNVYTEREAMSALAHGFVLLFSSNWYFYQTDNDGNIVATMLTNGTGHAMSIFGYLQEDKKPTRFAVRNQMGSKIFYGKNHPLFPMRGTGLTDFNSFKWDLRQNYASILAVGRLDLVNPAARRS